MKRNSGPNRPRNKGKQRGGGQRFRHGGTGGRNDFRRQGPRPPKGPKTCPMCGAAVNDLRVHIEQKHDDPTLHPRD